MIAQVRRWLPGRALVVVLDSTYAVLELLAQGPRLRPAVTLVTRLRLDAALYDPAPPRAPQTKGAPRKKGARQPTLAQRVDDPATIWERVTLRWYGGVQRSVELASGTAVWYHPGKPAVPLRWVLIRDPLGQFTTQALLCTDQSAAPPQIVEGFVLRWRVAVTYEDARAHLGIETQRQWSPHAIARTTPRPRGAVLARHLAGPAAPPRPRPARAASGVVRQTAPGLRRHARLGASPSVAGLLFLSVARSPRYGRNPAPSLRALDGHARLRRVKWIKSSSGPESLRRSVDPRCPHPSRTLRPCAISVAAAAHRAWPM